MKKIFLIIIFAFIMSLCGSICIFAEADRDVINIDLEDDFKWESYQYGDKATLPYFMYIPEDYTEEKQYPVIVILQRAGKDEKASRDIMEEMAEYLFSNSNKDPYQSIVIAAQSTVDMGWGYGYGDVNETDSSKALIQLIAALNQNYSIDVNRIYLIGASMGGYGVWDMLIRHNDIFAAGITIGGSGDYSNAAILKDTPIYVFHGEEDKVVFVRNARNMVEAIHNAGGTQVKYVEYKKLGHDIVESAMMTSGLFDWLFSQNLSDRYPDRGKSAISTYTGGDVQSGAANTNDPSGNVIFIAIAVVAFCALVAFIVSYLCIRSRKIKLINKV